VRIKVQSDDEQLQELCQAMNLAIKKKLEFTDCEYLIEVLAVGRSFAFVRV
ncbi:unnamed protein product, partial [marine sediment metagenome]